MYFLKSWASRCYRRRTEVRRGFGSGGGADLFSICSNLPAPEVIAVEIVVDLEVALEQFREILADMDGTSIEVQGA